jgi:Protein of unknown function (DUF998)
MVESPKPEGSSKGTITLAFALMFAIILVTVHAIEPERNFGPINLYSLGSFGIVMRTGFVVLGLAFLSLVAGLRGLASRTRLYIVDLILFSIAGAGLLTIGVFNTDAPGTSQDLSGLIHSLAANIWSMGALVGILLFAVAFRQGGNSLAIGRFSRNLGIALVITYLAGFLDYETFFMLIQPRLFFALVVVWMSFIASRLRSGKLANISAIHGND